MERQDHSRSKSRDKDKEKHSRRDREHNSSSNNRNTWGSRDNYNNRDRSNQHYGNNRNNNRNNSYGKYNNNSSNRGNPGPRRVRGVHRTQIDAPKTFLLSNNFTGVYVPKMVKNEQHPQRVEASNLGELKNKITPIQKLWSSHIKQYLNISQFVEIHRHKKSLAYGNIEYGKTMVKYEEDSFKGSYSNKEEQPQIFSRAYFKLWEILETGVLEGMENQEMSIGCVAEGPGGFIHALVDYRLRQQKEKLRIKRDCYNAITLRISGATRNAKDWTDNRGVRLFERLTASGQSINLSYGATNTGDLLKTKNIEHFASQIKQKCQLVTGDGGIECIGDKQFEYQEVFNSKLFLGEIITALHIQAKGGKFILKIYDIGFEISRQLILMLAVHYERVKIVKPITSRPGNSEKYLLCEGFRGVQEEKLEELKKVLQEWVDVEPNLNYFENKEFAHSLFDFSRIEGYAQVYQGIKEANDWFVEEQMQKIEEGLQLSQKHRESSRSIEEELRSHRWEEQMSFAYEWCKKYGLPVIEVDIVEKKKLPQEEQAMVAEIKRQ